MRHQAVKVRIYPTQEQVHILAQHFGCARWWWNYALNQCIETYKETGKGLSRAALNAMLPKLKKDKETEWLKDCYSQVLQAVSLNLSRAYQNFFEGRAKYPRFKSYHHRQSIQYPQRVCRVGDCLKFPGKLGTVKAIIHRPLDGEIKTVTVSRTPSGKYYASVLMEYESEDRQPSTEGKVIGIDLGIKDFAITYDGEKTSKFGNPKHLAKYEKKLAKKQRIAARKKKSSNGRKKARKIVAKVYERIGNVRQDYLHKLSRKIVDQNQVVVVENLNVKGMVRNHKLAKAISDLGWGIFVNFLSYKCEKEGKVLVEINRWFPSSKTCSNCHYQIKELPLDVRAWTCPSCGTHHDRDGNAANNIRAEGIRMLSSSGTGEVNASGEEVRPRRGRPSKLRHSSVKLEAPTSTFA
ncbi:MULTISPECIES: RNA-guided endonuclease TnpB family protein [Moorena]|uniref:RNA-guided endonuclease InsQ/TnpB family protein n=1 Tax=Moorena TaxID=1155738 RepID=UPI0005C824A0|nr:MULTISPECIES: RNA-guided endonuclease TnpB family protein [Moorena]NEP31958.1 IS200/IS605 family element transposase accessory protein TnpB [Moorena sp. SIO3B2]NEP68808.1 IS200/IS605 family element transposase accessory protein TnpB [Moorena sp. SIO3A5]NEQ05969.1 IS200/IS605 family element transposase accessory protein TnpB [Moorena sp. SIO4E2]NER86612.1 IS200/IS605 family element transposase accessory protein TnpB [Moorena sp. SIO3A2]NES45223.1 IS200/IS605 family element transposase access